MQVYLDKSFDDQRSGTPKGGWLAPCLSYPMKLPYFIRALAGSLSLTVILTGLQAKILDDFNAEERSGWEDSNPIGLPVAGGKQANGRFTFDLPPFGQPYFVASTKRSETFELQEGRTIEFRVDLISGQGPDSFAVLGFIPTSTAANSLAGYGFAKSETDILITKGINKYFFNEHVEPAVKNENVTLVLNLSVKEGNVHVYTAVLDKEDGNRVLWEKTVVDTPAKDVLANGEDDPSAPYLTTGNFVLYLYCDGGTDSRGYQVVYDQAETFVCDMVLLDDFDAAEREGWEDSNPANLPVPGGVQAGGRFTFNLPMVGQSYFVGSTKKSKSFELEEGTRHEFSVDLVSGRGPDSFAVLAFIPTGTGANSLAGYGLAKSETDILITKGINKYFFNENVAPPVKNENVTLHLSLTVQSGQVTIRGRVFDRDDNNAVLFDRTFVDTPAKDVLSDGEDDPPAPFLTTGHVVLYLYGDAGTDPEGYQVVYDNLMACAPAVVGNEAPIISEVSPATGANFLPASTSITFKATDDQPLADESIVVKLNGQIITSTNGLVLGGSGTVRTATLGGLESNTNYVAELIVTDSEGVTRTETLYLDTFVTSNLLIEAEDYNFEAGGFFNTPVRTPEGSPADNSYTDRVGTAEVDYLDTRAASNNSDTPYRTQDPVRMARSLDLRRPAFDPEAGVFDYDVGDIAAGEWLNYTREVPAGTYEVYLREAVINFATADSVLEQVTGDPGQPDQTTQVVGTFFGRLSGYSFRNVPLTDATGQEKMILRLDGATTLRLRHLTADTDSGNRLLNYLILVPVPDPGEQAATVSFLNLADGTTVNTTEPEIEAVILNRDTKVVASSVKLFLNSIEVEPEIETTDDGVTVTYLFSTLPPAGEVQQARLTFVDDQGDEQSTDWSFTITYLQVDPASRYDAPGPDRGFKVRVTQAEETGENNLDRAEAQLAANSTIPKFYDTNVVATAINFSQDALFGGWAGYFEEDEAIPGQADEYGSDNYAMEVLVFLDLPAGVTRFGVRSDDGYKLANSPNPTASTVPLAFVNGGAADVTFDVFVATAGVYPFRFVWYERSGGAHVEWFTVDRTTGERTLVNGAGGIAAYTSAAVVPTIQVLGASSLDSPFAPVTGAVVDLQQKTVTVPATAEAQYFRLSSETAPVVSGATLSDGNLVIRYE